MTEHRIRLSDGSIATSATLGCDALHRGLFDPAWWEHQGKQAGTASGRGTVHFVGREGDWALRHYRRGGLVGRVIRDVYLFTGEARVRSLAEQQILLTLREARLPVPEPVAARYRRRGLWYTADIITRVIPDSLTLTQAIHQGQEVDWAAVGRCIRDFHDFGLDHADLNAHNILIGADDSVHLIDFDRARLRGDGGSWRRRNLERLLRSLRKISDEATRVVIERRWGALLAGYG